MKKFSSFLLALILMTLFCFSTEAASKPSLKCDDVKTNTGEQFEVPFILNSNNGIMGFAFELTYDSAVFEIVSVKKGDIINTGIFNDSFGSSLENRLKVIWTGTENIYANGTLFIVKFKAKESARGNHIIQVKSLQDDTFDENWNDVNISCSNLNVTINALDETSENTFFEKIVAFFKMIIGWISDIFM